MKRLILSAVPNIPLLKPGDKLGLIIYKQLCSSHLTLKDGDILVIAQKAVSKVEGRQRNLDDVIPSRQACRISKIVEKDPRFVQLVLNESKKVIRTRPGTLIVQHKLGFICANAGIDHSNVEGLGKNNENWVLLLPENPDKSADELREFFRTKCNKNIGILIIDSHGRAWRMGIVGISIGFSMVPGLVDMRGKKDIFGYQLKVTQIAAVDELAAAASLLMGQVDEKTPVIHVRGFPYPLREGRLAELIRPEKEDLFR